MARAMPHLLIVEDYAPLGSALKRALDGSGYRADWVRHGEEAIAAASAQAYDVALLDLGLPDISGLEVLRALRARDGELAIIIITARDRTEQRIAGLDAGADDYLVKPIDVDELAARVRAQLRRRDGRSSDLLECGPVTLDLRARVVLQGGEPVTLTAKEFRVAAHLMRRAGRFVSKAELESMLYDHESYAESNTVEVAVYALRRKLGRDFILTARGLGYMVAR
jgi:DNA-binding response OmpR family regulator